VRHTGAARVQQRRRQRLQAAQQGETSQHERVPQRRPQAEAGLGDRVVGRLLVGGQGDLGGEFGRHLVAVPQDVADVPARQPVPQAEREQEKDDEQNRKRG